MGVVCSHPPLWRSMRRGDGAQFVSRALEKRVNLVSLAVHHSQNLQYFVSGLHATKTAWQ